MTNTSTDEWRQEMSEHIEVERVECVSFESGFEELADPIWRVEVGGICADFETETAANNYANAIEARIKQARLEAIEEAANLATRGFVYGQDPGPAIRALAGEQGE